MVLKILNNTFKKNTFSYTFILSIVILTYPNIEDDPIEIDLRNFTKQSINLWQSIYSEYYTETTT